ncbi:MAG: class I SAM-dependent methyltransferase [Nitrososphaera sp.]|nr:class I SAM-dependent methyltransferase [Nitrososphaera sp.]
MHTNTTYEPYSQEPEYIEANRALLATLPLDAVQRVLDLACGTGLLSELLLTIKPGLTIHGLDLSNESLDIGRKRLREKGLLVDSRAELDRAAADGRGAVLLEEGNAMEFAFEPQSFDLVMMGNAIHLMPDKPLFLRGVLRVLAPNGVFTFNSVFFVGTFGEGTEPVYTAWMMEALQILAEKNRLLQSAGSAPIQRVRGKVGKAFDKGWMTSEEWEELLRRNGFSVMHNYKRPVGISQRGLELVGAYGGLAEVLLSGYPVEVASECLQEAVGPAFRKFGIKEITRYWLEIMAAKS